MKNSTGFTNKTEKSGVHRSKCTPAEILSLPTVSILLVLLLLWLLLLFPANELPNRTCIWFFMEQICHITLAVVHQHRIVFLAVSRLHTVNGRAFLFLTNGKPCVHQLSGIHTAGLLFQLSILLQALIYRSMRMWNLLRFRFGYIVMVSGLKMVRHTETTIS